MSEKQGDQMALAMRAMAHHAGASWRTDRRGWTDEQWIEDAEKLMDDLDGSITSLVNGHVLALLRFWRDHPHHPTDRPEVGGDTKEDHDG